MTDEFTELVLYDGVEYTFPEFEALVTKQYGENAGCYYLDVSSWDDLSKGRYVFIPHELVNDRGEHGRFTKLHTTETTDV